MLTGWVVRGPGGQCPAGSAQAGITEPGITERRGRRLGAGGA